MSLPFAGIVVVWSGDRPRHTTHRIGSGFVFGRDHVEDADDRISREHVRFDVDKERIRIADLSSRNGTYVNGEAIDRAGAYPALPAIVRTGSTISVVLADVRPYEGVAVARRGSVVVAGSLAEQVRALDGAAVAEENVMIFGTASIGRELALDYARTLGGKQVMIDTTKGATSVGHVLDAAGPARSIVLVIGHPLEDADWQALAQWLETDVRFILVMRHDTQAVGMPTEVARKLAGTIISIPRLRLDELPTTLYEMIQARLPRASMHASAIETALLRVRETDEDHLLACFRDAIDLFGRTGSSTFRAEHVDGLIVSTYNPRHVRIGQLPG